jgi:basic amino acid/polyamine antiporter, APA family
MLFFFILGDILGAGIYVLVGQVAGEAGGAIWTAFLLALVLALFTAAAYAELATKYPHAGGAALYAGKALRSKAVAFLVAFAVMASGIASASTLARAFGGDYLRTFVELPVLPVALAFLLAIALINFYGVIASLRVNIGLTLVEVGGLLLVVAIAIGAIAAGEGAPSRAIEFDADAGVVAAILSGAALAFYALIGFEDSVNLAEEVRDPARAYPRALFGGLLAAGLIYMLVTVTASIAVPTAELAVSSGPLVEVAQRGPLAVSPEVFSAIALLAISNGALINMIMVSRLLYGMAVEEVLPRFLQPVHPTRRTPWAAITFSTALAAVLAATGDVRTLASTTVLLLLLVFIVVNASVLLLRGDRVRHDHFHAPTVLPLLGIGSCVLVLTQVDPAAWARAGVLGLAGLALLGFDRLAPRR